MRLLQKVNILKPLKSCEICQVVCSLNVCYITVHRTLLSGWWLYIQQNLELSFLWAQSLFVELAVWTSEGKQLLLINIVHLLDKYNKIPQNTRYIHEYNYHQKYQDAITCKQSLIISLCKRSVVLNSNVINWRVVKFRPQAIHGLFVLLMIVLKLTNVTTFVYSCCSNNNLIWSNKPVMIIRHYLLVKNHTLIASDNHHHRIKTISPLLITAH